MPQQFLIQLDNPSLIYFPGQVVSGRVVIRENGEENTKGIQLNFWGEATTHFTRRHNESYGVGKDHHYRMVTRHYWGQDTIFTFARYLLGNGSDKVTIPSGESQYPFTFQLPPSNLPSSFAGAFGKVEYSLKATMIRSWKTDPETRQIIHVNTTADLNTVPQAAKPFEMTTSKVFCCLCCASGPLNMKVTINKTGFCPGEIIEVNVAIDNLSSTKILDLSVDLFQTAIFHAQGLASHTCNSLVNHKRGQGVDKGENDSWRVEIQVPPCPPTRLGCCRIIDVQYSVKASAKTPGLSKDLVIDCPVLIGNVPLKDGI